MKERPTVTWQDVQMQRVVSPKTKGKYSAIAYNYSNLKCLSETYCFAKEKIYNFYFLAKVKAFFLKMRSNI